MDRNPQAPVCNPPSIDQILDVQALPGTVLATINATDPEGVSLIILDVIMMTFYYGKLFGFHSCDICVMMVSCLVFTAVISVMMMALCYDMLFEFLSCDKCNDDGFML